MVGVILIEAGFEPLDAVAFIRKRRRGALNSLQLQFLVDEYKRRASKKSFFPKQMTKGSVLNTFSKVFAFVKPNSVNSSPSSTTSSPTPISVLDAIDESSVAFSPVVVVGPP
jgi:hypothetical protein